MGSNPDGIQGCLNTDGLTKELSLQQSMKITLFCHYYLSKFEQTPGEWRTEEPEVLQSMVSQRIGQELATEQQQHSKIIKRSKHTLPSYLERHLCSEVHAHEIK